MALLSMQVARASGLLRRFTSRNDEQTLLRGDEGWDIAYCSKLLINENRQILFAKTDHSMLGVFHSKSYIRELKTKKYR